MRSVNNKLEADGSLILPPPALPPTPPLFISSPFLRYLKLLGPSNTALQLWRGLAETFLNWQVFTRRQTRLVQTMHGTKLPARKINVDESQECYKNYKFIVI